MRFRCSLLFTLFFWFTLSYSAYGAPPIASGIAGLYSGSMTTSTADINTRPKPVTIKITAQINEFGYFEFFDANGNILTDGEGVIGTQQGLVFFTNDAFVVEEGKIQVKGKNLLINGFGYVDGMAINEYGIVTCSMKLKKVKVPPIIN